METKYNPRYSDLSYKLGEKINIDNVVYILVRENSEPIPGKGQDVALWEDENKKQWFVALGLAEDSVRLIPAEI